MSGISTSASAEESACPPRTFRFGPWRPVYEGPGGCYLWDTEIAGFGLRIYPTGRKSFLITYRSKGRQRFYTLGRFGEMTVHQARAEALLTLGRARQGEDPSGDRRAAHRAPRMTDLARMDHHQ